jgi:Mn2+/Fe2+ NRAMP family transporter
MSYDYPLYWSYPYNLYGTQAIVVKEEQPQEAEKPKLNMALISAFAGLLAFLMLMIVVLVATRKNK